MTRIEVKVPATNVYIHFPWCLEKCPYCDFTSYKSAREAIDGEGYADAVLREFEARRAQLQVGEVDTVFVGGGTPSLWRASALRRVLREIVGDSRGTEVTIECNPSSLDQATAAALVEAGATRLSLGVQSLDDDELRFLGRLHDAGLARRALAAAIETGARVSADLIFGLPGQPIERAVAHAAELASFGLSHLSAYALTIEPGTKFGELARRGRLPLADDDAVCDAFLAVEEVLARRGLDHYEVSNYASPGQQSRHNVAYWRGKAYLGLGCAAVGCLDISADRPTCRRRYRNHLTPVRYLESSRVVQPGLPHDADGLSESCEALDAPTLLRERIMLGLRLSSGLDLTAAGAELGLSREETWTVERNKRVALLTNEGRLAREGDHIWIPPTRRLGTDGVACLLF